MGTTNSPLILWVLDAWLDAPAVIELRKSGHDVYSLAGVSGGGSPRGPDVDLILHPAAHQWDASYFDHKSALPAALTWARRRKKEAE